MIQPMLLFAQSTKRVAAIEVKESKLIDSAIEDIVNKTTTKKNDKHKTYYIEIEVGHHYLDECRLDVSCVWTDNPLIYTLGYNRISDKLVPKYDDNLRYFFHNGQIVFISGADEPYNLFKNTIKKKSFVFYLYSPSDANDALSGKIFAVGTDNYKNGKLISEELGNR
jgi:hypothetical protein